MTTTCLLLLPDQTDAPAFWCRLDAHGQPLAQGWLTPGQPLPAEARADRGVLALPGPSVLCRRLALQAHTPAQAQAAARAALAVDWAGDIATACVHVVADAGTDQHWVWACDAAALQRGLAQAAGHGLDVAQVLPLAWLLASGTDLAEHQSLWVCRTPALAAAAEPELIALLSGEADPVTPPLLIDHLHLPAHGPCLRGTGRTGPRQTRTGALPLCLALAAILLAAPLGLLASGGWLAWQTRQQHASTEQLAGQALTQAGYALPAQFTPTAALQYVLAEQQQTTAQWQLAADLLNAIASQPGLGVQQLHLAEGQAQLQLAHSEPAALEALRNQLQAHGLQWQPGPQPTHWTVHKETLR